MVMLCIFVIIPALVVNAIPLRETENVNKKDRIRRDTACDLSKSPLGNRYFRKSTPWGQNIDLPCPSATLFQLESCSCEKKSRYWDFSTRENVIFTEPLGEVNIHFVGSEMKIATAYQKCSVLSSDPSSYMEYIDSVGEWVTGQCPRDMIYRTDYCMCTLQKDYETTTIKTSVVTVAPKHCPYRQAGPTAYEEFVPSLNDWITNYCPHGTTYSAIYCKCVSEVDKATTASIAIQATVIAKNCPYRQAGPTAYEEFVPSLNDWVTNYCPHGTIYSAMYCKCIYEVTTNQNIAITSVKVTVQPPANCSYVKVGPSTYKEYRSDLGDWLTADCPAGQIFSTTWCMCLIDGQTPDFSRDPTTPPLVQNCKFQPSGPTSYNEYIPQIGAWVTSNCAAGQVYSQPHCTCVDKNLVQHPTELTTVMSTTLQQNPDCDLRPIGQSSYQKFEDSIQDWVTISCHAGMVFNALLCHCVREGVVVTSLPVTSKDVGDTNVVTNPNCPYVPVNQRSYKEYVAALAVWVTNDCPSDMVFNVAMCSCHPDGSADIIVVPITTVPPLNKPTVTNCPYTKSDTGYLEYVPGMNIWIENVCPVNHEFVKEYCTCLSLSDISKIPKVTITPTTKITNTETPQPQSTPPTTPTTAPKPTTTTANVAFTTPKYATITAAPTSTTTTAILTSTKTTTTEAPTTTKTITSTNTAAAPTSTKTTTLTATPTTTTTAAPTSTKTATYAPTSTKPAATALLEVTTMPLTTYLRTTEVSTTSPVHAESTAKTTPKEPLSTASVIATSKPCNKSASPIGSKYYTTIVPGWGELTYMCPTGKSFFLSLCDCAYADLKTATSTTTTTTIKPTTTTTLPTTTTTLPTTMTTANTTTSKQAVCPLVPSILGPGYFTIHLGDWGSIDMMCPSKQTFAASQCRCVL